MCKNSDIILIGQEDCLAPVIILNTETNGLSKSVPSCLEQQMETI